MTNFVLSVQSVKMKILENHPQIVSKLLMTLDSEVTSEGLNPPSYSADVIELTLKDMSECHGANTIVTSMLKKHAVS